MNAMTPILHMSVARLNGSKFTTSGAAQNNSSLTRKQTPQTSIDTEKEIVNCTQN